MIAGRKRRVRWTPERIKALRNAWGETQAQFAERLNVSKSAIRFWEQGQGKPSKLAEFVLDRVEADLKEPQPA